MDGIRFILEDPQAANSRQKKRSRLVTACDTCRAKKIKCHQSSDSAKCEACRISKSPCRFRDRERYHAQRSGSVSASSSSFNPSDSEDSRSFTESPGYAGRRATLPSFAQCHTQSAARSSSLPPALPRLPSSLNGGPVAHRTGSPGSEIGPLRSRRPTHRRFTGVTGSTVSFDGRISNYSSPALSLGISPLAKFRDLTLDSPTSDLSAYFDPTRPDCPSRKYLDDNLDAFFDNLQRRFLFLNRDSLRHAVVQQSLSATFSNCIAALALRFDFSPTQETTVPGNPRIQGFPFLGMAKDSIVVAVHTPSFETLHSLILLSWAEYGGGRENGLNIYSALAVQMASDLLLGYEETIQSVPTEYERLCLRETWWSVVTLDIISSWVTGNPPNSNLQHCTTLLPLPSFGISGPLSTPPMQPYLILHELLAIRDNLLQATTISFDIAAQPTFGVELQDVCSRLLSIRDSLPSNLEFTVVNLRRSFQDHQELVYVFLHLILNSLIAMSHCPSLFRPISNSSQIPEVALTSARSILDILVMLDQLEDKEIISTPFLDFPMAIAARTFALDSRYEREAVTSREQLSLSNRGRLSEVNLGVCNNMMGRLGEFWGNVSNMRMNVECGTVWTYICPIQQSPVAIPSALDLRGVERYCHVPYLHVDATEEHQEIGLTYSDSEVSREPSPLLFDFPGMMTAVTDQRLHHQDSFHRPSSDPTPTTVLPPISLAGGFSSYDDLTNYLTPYADDSPSSVNQGGDYFPTMAGGDCLAPLHYEGQGDQTIHAPQSIHASQSIHAPQSFNRHSWGTHLVDESASY